MTATHAGVMNVLGACDNYVARMPGRSRSAMRDGPDADARRRESRLRRDVDGAQPAHAPRVHATTSRVRRVVRARRLPGPAALDHRALRRYLAYLQTRGFARTDDRPARPRRCARTSASCGGTDVVTPDVSPSTSARRRSARSCRACPRRADAAALLGRGRSRPSAGRRRSRPVAPASRAATSRCSSCCTAPDCA